MRVEDKYNLDPSKMYLLEKRIGAVLPKDLLGGEQGYQVSSIYFDTIWDTCYRDILAGNEHRTKYRIRYYNNDLSFIKLEIKQKNGSRVSKLSEVITMEEMRFLLSGQRLPDLNGTGRVRNLFNHSIQTALLRPRILVTYDRTAYTYESGNVRITFDRNIRATNCMEQLGGAIAYDLPETTHSILEVKYDSFLPHFIAQTLENGNMMQTSHSKYGLCRAIYVI